VDSPSSQARDATTRGDLAELKRLLEYHEASIVRADEDPEELTSLHMAAAGGSREVVEFLLSDDICADPSAVRINNFTPLHSAAMQGHATICELLVGAGADPNIQTNPQGYAPIHSAAWGGHVAAVRVLLQHGARQDLRNHRNETPIDTAQRQGQEAVVRAIKEWQA